MLSARLSMNAGKTDVAALLFNTGYTANIAAALAALRKLKKHPRGVRRLRKNIGCFSEALKSHGILCPVDSAVIAVPAGSEENAVRASEFLKENGFLIPDIRFPSVPRGQAILRVTLMSSHTPKEIEAAAAAIARAIHPGSGFGKSDEDNRNPSSEE